MIRLNRLRTHQIRRNMVTATEMLTASTFNFAVRVKTNRERGEK